jgi:murein lipoprotein
MTQAPVTVTYSLEEVLGQLMKKMDRLDEKIDRLDQKVDNKVESLQKDIVEVKVELVKLQGEVGSIGKRLDTQEFINRSVVVGFVLALVAGVIKLFLPEFPHS